MSEPSVDSLRPHQKLCGLLGPLGHGALNATLLTFAGAAAAIGVCSALAAVVGPLHGLLIVEAVGLFSFIGASCAFASVLAAYFLSGAEKYEHSASALSSRTSYSVGAALALSAAFGASGYAALALRAEKSAPIPSSALSTPQITHQPK